MFGQSRRTRSPIPAGAMRRRAGASARSSATRAARWPAWLGAAVIVAAAIGALVVTTPAPPPASALCMEDGGCGGGGCNPCDPGSWCYDPCSNPNLSCYASAGCGGPVCSECDPSSTCYEPCTLACYDDATCGIGPSDPSPID